MSRVPTWTKAGIIAGIILLAGIVGWRLPSTARPPVELTFVRYEYDAIVLRLINRTSSRLIVISPGTTSTTNVRFNAFVQKVEARSELELCTARSRLVPSSIPARIDLQCMPLPSRRRQRATALLKKVGVKVALTNFLVSVDLPLLIPSP